jgi:hypothetical protein
VYHYFLEDATLTVLFRDVVRINYQNVIKIVRVVLKKIITLYDDQLNHSGGSDVHIDVYTQTAF